MKQVFVTILVLLGAALAIRPLPDVAQLSQAKRDPRPQREHPDRPPRERPEIEEMRRMRTMIMDQNKQLRDQQQRLDELEKKSNAELQTLKTDFQSCKSSLASYVDKAVSHSYQDVAVSRDPIQYETTVYGCLYEIINLSCPVDSFVFVTGAEFGQYGEECTGCCAPNATADCLESLESFNAQEWTDLRLSCNYNQNCGFQVDPHVMSTCPLQQVANYLTITYVCSNEIAAPPAQQTEPVAFTAYETDWALDYLTGSVIDFPFTYTNIGGHYSTITNRFTCPYDGLYMFSINVLSDDEDELIAELTMDNQLIVSAFADDLPISVHETHHQASQTAFVECPSGSQVWVESGSSGEMFSSNDRLFTFSGVLLNQYNITRAANAKN